MAFENCTQTIRTVISICLNNIFVIIPGISVFFLCFFFFAFVFKIHILNITAIMERKYYYFIFTFYIFRVALKPIVSYYTRYNSSGYKPILWASHSEDVLYQQSTEEGHCRIVVIYYALLSLVYCSLFTAICCCDSFEQSTAASSLCLFEATLLSFGRFVCFIRS